jgi:hypothetical protein
MTYRWPAVMGSPLSAFKFDGGLDVITAVINNRIKLHLVSSVLQLCLPVNLLSLLLLPC